MQTPEEQIAFFDAQWPALKTAVESAGASGAIGFIDGRKDPLQRRVLYFFCRRGLVFKEWRNKSLDTYAAVAQAGIRAFLEAADGESDPEARRGRIQAANVMSYNLSADLADCWPGDEEERTRAHFEAGLAAAGDCVRWREELGNPPRALSMAWWAKGMHQLSLGDAAAAAESWKRSLEYARDAANGEDKDPGEEFGVLLGEGYLGLAEWAQGDDAGKQRYDRALAGFRGQLDDDARKDDAQFGIDQLETVRTKYVR